MAAPQYDPDLMRRPGVAEVIELALKLRNLCIKHGIPPDAIINGVAWHAEEVRKESIASEKRRVSSVLGLLP